MIYRSSKREFDAGVLVFIGAIFITIIICVTTIVARFADYKHIEKMEQIKTCKEEK